MSREFDSDNLPDEVLQKLVGVAKSMDKSIDQHFQDQGWSDLQIVLAKIAYARLTELLTLYHFPLNAEEAPEILRALANAIEVGKAETKRIRREAGLD